MRTITDHLASVDGVSSDLATDLAAAFPTWKDLATATTDDLRAVKGVGPVLATRIQAAAVEASPTTAASTRTDEASAAARTAVSTTGRANAGARSAVAERADRSATATKAAAARAKETAEGVVDDAADTSERAGAATDRVQRDFADSVERRQFGPVTLPADLPWPVSFALDTTETVVGLGLKVTSGVLETVGRKLR